MPEWQIVSRERLNNVVCEVHKLRLPGGWLYQTVIVTCDGTVISSTTVYVHGVNNG